MTELTKSNYVDKAEMLEAMREYFETDVIPDRLHVIFYTMADHISRKNMFLGYTYREDMISAAYLRCLYALRLKKFDINNKTQCFSYFQSTIEREFWKFRNKEKTYQQRKWNELSTLISDVENKHHITIVLPDDVKEKMYLAGATKATLSDVKCLATISPQYTEEYISYWEENKESLEDCEDNYED